MADMKSFSERFRVEKVNASGDVERVTVQIGLDGLKIMNADGTRTNSSYELSHISRWSMRGNNLILYTKTPVDVEERQITLRSSETAIRNVMDTLTCCCMQLSEILQSTGKSTSDRETANSLHQLVKGNGKKTPSLPNVDEVEFWHGAEKQGYLQSQGDVTKFWRRRFFVLKQGYLFRFMSGDINESAKPRGVVDLSKVTDVVDGRASTGKANSIKLATSTGYVCYVADSETEMVEWMSALEGAVQRIVKHVAGYTEEEPASRPSRPLSPGNDWTRQLESSLAASSSSSTRPSASSHYPMVDIVGYDNPPATAPPASSSYGGGGGSYGGGGGSYGGGGGSYGGGGGNGYSDSIDYSQISGIAGVAKDSGPSDPANDLYLNYGGPPSSSGAAPQPSPYPSSYPTPSPSSYPTSAPPASSYPDASTPSYYTPQAASYAPQQPPSYQAASLIDQVPHQAPSYPYYQQPSSAYPSAQPAAAAPAAPTSNSWQVLYTPDGKPYYHNPSTGLTQWEAPPGY